MTGLPAPDMHGIRADFHSEVRPEDQARLAAEFPELRLLWNAKLKLYQLCVREDGWREGFYGMHGDGVLDGWALIPPDYAPPLDIARVIVETRVRVRVHHADMQKKGFANASDYVDHLWDEAMKKKRAQETARIDEEFWGIGPTGLKTGPDFFQRADRASSMPRRPVGLGAKELAKRQKRLDEALRKGAPLVVPA